MPLTDPPADAVVVGAVPAPGLHVMSWNVRRPLPAVLSRPADRWDRRAPLVAALLADEQPAVLGAQEVLPAQSEVILDALGGSYRRLGHGRGRDGTGEACPIFYDAGRLEVLDWRQTALSDTPDRPGSVSWGAVFPRVLVWARLRDRATGGHFLAANTHLDPFSRRSRVRAAAVIAGVITGERLPAVVTGDLNAGPEDAGVRALRRRAGVADTWDLAPHRRGRDQGTYTGYGEPRVGGTRLDRILVTATVHVELAALNARRDGGWPSDHLPVHAVIRTPGERSSAA